MKPGDDSCVLRVNQRKITNKLGAALDHNKSVLQYLSQTLQLQRRPSLASILLSKRDNRSRGTDVLVQVVDTANLLLWVEVTRIVYCHADKLELKIAKYQNPDKTQTRYMPRRC